ncbi:hypothetical protein LJC27_00715 [Christensenellaceae bacterium OttesenSCG-928-M15]|nr:hypothetical protein [Christensenellaceae bacterium OttesenSCG-928-M15]
MMIKQQIEQTLERLLDEYQEQIDMPGLWRKPVIKYVDANHPEIPLFRDTVYPEHYLPADFLEAPTVILVYFVPFGEAAVKSNVGGKYASKLWIHAYTHADAALPQIDAGIVDAIRKAGYQAAVPTDTSYAGEGIYKSRWSHRHIARLGGMGTFGLNNLLLTDSGCCGYYSSVVTNLPIAPGQVLQEERCLYKRNGTCGLCVKRCVAGALTIDGFERNRCYDMCMEDAQHYKDDDFIHMADACGKCAAGMPCALRNPIA